MIERLAAYEPGGRLRERNYATIVTDPFDHKAVGYDALKLKADIVTVSHDAPGHANYDAGKIVCKL